MKARITDIHCTQCGAPAAFDIRRQLYLCSYCGGTVEPGEAVREKEGFRKMQADRIRNEVAQYRLVKTSCSGCGAATFGCGICTEPRMKDSESSVPEGEQ